MKFSVIIPTYGRPEYLGEAIASVLAQTWQDFEILVVDDASPDPVQVPNDPRIQLIRRDVNGGGAAATNTGIGAASGDAVCFLDDDDLYAQDRLRLAAEGLKRAPITVCWSRWLDGAEVPKRALDGDVHNAVLEQINPPIGATAVRRDELVPFDESFRSVYDLEWWIRATRTAHVSTIPRFGYLVRRHPGQRMGYGAEQRIMDSHKLMHLHHEYFAANPKARAFRWRRIGLMSRKIGDYRGARRAFLKAFQTSPSLRDVKHFMVSVVR